MDTKIEILPNAVAAQKDEVVSWLSGSSLDTQNQKKVQSKSLPEQQTTEKTLHSHRHTESDDTHSILSEQTIGDATVIQKESNATILDGAEITILNRDLTSATTNEETILENNTGHVEITASKVSPDRHPKNRKTLPIILISIVALISIFAGILYLRFAEDSGVVSNTTIISELQEALPNCQIVTE